MASVNKVILVGRLGTDPELRHTSQGKAICTLSLATNRTFTDKENKKQEQTSWHRVIAWSKQAELCKTYLAKGRQIYVEGRLEPRSYTDKSGAKRFTTEVIAQSVVFLDKGGHTYPESSGNNAFGPSLAAYESMGEEIPSELSEEDNLSF